VLGDLAVKLEFLLSVLCVFVVKMNCNHSGGTDICDAVVTREQSAATVSFQRQAPSLSPSQNVNSAAMRELPARQFGGKCAKFENVAKYLQHLQH